MHNTYNLINVMFWLKKWKLERKGVEDKKKVIIQQQKIEMSRIFWCG